MGNHMRLGKNARSSTRRFLLLATVVAVSVSVLTPAFVRAASAQVDIVPTTRVFHVVGHGWGHGHGMSQDGANGAAAVKHMSASQIVSFYYPHTAAGSISNPKMRILLQSTAASYLEIRKPTGSNAVPYIHDVASGYNADLPLNASDFRFTVGTSSITVQQYVSGAWKPWAPTGHTSFAGPLNVGTRNPSTAAPMRVLYPSGVERDYRGYLQTVRAGANNADALAVMPMEDYLRGVVPRESPSSWPAAALQAQAIAARSYSEYEREHAGSRDYDICDSTSCQVFGGTTEVQSDGTVINLEASSTNSAVQATAGQIRTYNGAAIFAQYSASDGGYTTDGGAPYLIAQPDPYDGLSGSSSHSWSASLPASALEHAYPSIGTLRRITVTQRDGHGQWGGRVLQAVLEGSQGSAAVSGSAVSSAYSWPTHSDGVRSAWWEIVPTTTADFTGDHITDLSLWRSSDAGWYDDGHGHVNYGRTGDVPVPGDYNGDGTVERAVWRPANGGWYLNGSTTGVQYGTAGDIPVPGDYNGDGRTDLAVFRPSNNTWYVRNIGHYDWGSRTDIPVPADYDGDGKTDVAVWRPSNGTWYVNGTSTGTQYGVKGDIPVPSDYTGDGRAEFAVWRPSNGTWYIRGHANFQYGTAGDIPVPGDYNGDANADRVIFRPSNGRWYRPGHASVPYGISTDEPLPLPYAIYRSR
jgi:SpoIID/LytB domain protein